jgi:Fe(3+) dicitrate transport protein
MSWRSIPLVLLVCIFSLNCDPSAAQDRATGRVEGRVVTQAQDAALPGATVRVRGTERSKGTTTDADGRFVLSGLPTGSVTLQVRYVGYTPSTQAVRVRPQETTRLTIRLTPATIELSGVEITSSAWETRATVPGAATEVSVAELERIDPIGTQEALTYVPGVFGLSDDGIGQTRMSVGIRGLQPRRTQRVLVMEDGMPIQPAPYVFSPLYYNPAIERVEQIEVIKGSATIRHGPQTMAGVINYVTRRPQRETFGGSVRVTGGTNGFASVYGEFGGFGTDAVRPQIQLLAKGGDGFRDNNDFAQLNGTAKVRAQLGDDRSLYVKANIDYERLNATYTGLTPYTFRKNPDFNPKEDDRYRIFRAALGGIYNRRYSDRIQGTTRLYANVFDRPWWREKDVFVKASAYENSDIDAEPVSPSTPGPLIRVGISDAVEGDLEGPYFGNLRTFYVTGVEQTLDINHGLFGQSATLALGGRLHWERFQDDRKISDEVGVREGVFFRGDPSDPESLEIVGGSSTYETTALALYALEELQWGRLRLSPGFRLEVFEQEQVDRLAGGILRDKTNVVPLPGVGFNLDLGTYPLGGPAGPGSFHLFGGIHRGYTPPSSATFQIVGFEPPTAVDSEDDGFDLRAEKSWNTELGLRGRTDLGQFEVTGFYLHVEDLVGGRTSFQQNLGVVQSQGVEVRSKLNAGVLAGPLPTIDVSYTFMQSTVQEGVIPRALGSGLVDISGNELPAAPEHSATVGLSKSFPGIGLSLYADLRYKGRFYTDLQNLRENAPGAPPSHGERGPVPAHTVVDAGATYALNDALELKLTAKNVTDNVFIGSRLHSNPRQRDATLSTGIIPGPRRQVNLSVTYDF